MKNFKEYIVIEASINRLKQHLKNGEPMLFISGYRGENTPEQNNANTWALKRYFNIAGFGYNEIKGHYKEERDNGKFEDVDEKSLVVYTTPDKEQLLLDEGMSVGIKLKQSSIMFIYSDGKAYYISTRNDSWVGSIGTRKYVGRFSELDKNDIVDAFSSIQGKKFIFENVSEDIRQKAGQYNDYVLQESFLENIRKNGINCIQEWEKNLSVDEKWFERGKNL